MRDIEKKGRFLDLTYDYGFKIVFANQDTPELLMRFINEMIPERNILSITILNPEILPPDEGAKRTNYDIYCVDDRGNRFIVEIQRHIYEGFNDRLVVYSGDPLTRLLQRGEPYGDVRTLYVISILNGYLDVEDENQPFRDCLVRRASLKMDESGKILSDKYNFLFLQLPVAKEMTAGAGFLEKWSYYVRHMCGYEAKPEGLDEYFSLLFDCADRRNISKRVLSEYDRMERDAIQIEAEKQYAMKQSRKEGEARGLARGKAEGKAETAKAMLVKGLPVDIIAECTGLTPEQIAAL